MSAAGSEDVADRPDVRIAVFHARIELPVAYGPLGKVQLSIHGTPNLSLSLRSNHPRAERGVVMMAAAAQLGSHFD